MVYTDICPVCGKEFNQSSKYPRKTCSRTCWDELATKNKRGKHPTEETRNKQIKAMKGYIPQGRGAIKKGCKFGSIERPDFICPNCGVNHGLAHSLGNKFSEETKQKMRVIRRIIFNTPEGINTRRNNAKSGWDNLTPEQMKERKIILKESANKPERIEKNRENTQKWWNNLSLEEREIQGLKMKEGWDEENREWRRNETKKLWSNGTFDGIFTSPTSIEVKTFSFLDKVGIKYDKFHRINIGYKNRVIDVFIEPNICIEADGEYWHSEDCFGVNRKRTDEETDEILRDLGYIIYRILEEDFNNEKYLEILEKVISEHNLLLNQV